MRIPSPMCARVGFGMRTSLKAFLLALALLAGSVVRAQSGDCFAWILSSAPAIQYPDATSACAAREYSGGAVAVSPQVIDEQSAQCRYSVGGGEPVLDAVLALRIQIEDCNPCAAKAGDTTTQNLTLGWQRTNNPDADDYAVGPSWPPTTICDGQCAMTRGTATAAYVSQVPAANGLHRVSGDFPATFTGAQCTARSESADPNSPLPPCPGLLGSVNGRPVCVGTPSTPLPDNPRPPEHQTPPAGPGNPTAGPMPDSGVGSGAGGPGRTPPGGSGGPAGGGSNAAIPGGGSEGNGQGDGTPVPLGPDGRPVPGGTTGSGQPTPVDEAGMPSGAGAYDSATNAVNANRDAAVAGVNAAAGAAGKSTGWSFFFAFPTGCSPISLGAFAPYISGLDICQWQSMIHDLMSLVWLAATAFCCIGMVGRAVGGGGS